MRSTLIFLVVCAVIAISCEDRSIAVSPETQMAIDLEKIDTYLAENSITAEQHVSGLRFVVHQQGEGDRPGPDKCVRVNYKLWLLGEETPLEEGTNFAASLAPGKGIILGWRIGLKEIQKGGSITLYVPSGLAYGPIGNSKIPRNQVLIFHVELVNITGYNSAGDYCYPWP
jgi:FKBP-type peptidyl-prolyl cis-trans isomerase